MLSIISPDGTRRVSVAESRDGVIVKTYQLKNEGWHQLNTRLLRDGIFHVVLDEQHAVLARFR